MENQPTLDIQSLKQECPGVDFDAPFQFNKEFTVGHYVLEFLPTTLEIIKNSPNIKNDTILKFVKADFKDFRLPITRTQFMRYLQCTEAFADDFMEAQSSHFAVTFKPKEHKILQKYETVPFKINPQSKTSTCNYGIVQQVQMEGQKFARKEQNITNDAVINSELEILLKAPENPHLISYHASYEQGGKFYFILSPWCDLDLDSFLKAPMNHISPVICDFGLSKIFNSESKSMKIGGTTYYISPEQARGEKVGRSADIFALGAIYLELGMLLFGIKRKGRKAIGFNGFYTIAESDSVGELLLLFEKEGYEDFCALFRSLLEKMLDKKPDKRPTAFEVWEMTQDILAILKLEHHCDGVSGSPVDSEPSQKEVEGSSSDSDEEEDCFLYKPI
ncbi:hypothetical protein BATDEDRAFT_87872 [Batrachochytrium dendrobatidis JAM81]|uniref:non-specific serine/threonine protein kinase n=1 Tax=Batrachochytrium dendrobatidis (strain JAM81 / FGSC 10211) TaxID=684364 RepID=F4NZE6_BATDJ|nr:uncharacterized protein BATDEDRAFT_87872 [Batrachochytrium dendrobatidis JAM81]EGF81257.1 hypothetical protein BATDEDRAFT_87872 [Batrachochytrium dendrobatidis JAM81]|eukprot:XP_006678139.1 hypothetical protein BATDEDRAFT_87872 [Batrachochytrium dendrobatidis JAM81]